jgi:hypothetical protein
MEKMLKYSDFVDFMLNESRVWAHPDRIYTISPNFYNKVPAELIAHEYSTTEEITANEIYYIAYSCKKIDKKEGEELLKQKNYVVIVSEDNSINIVVGPKTSILTGKKAGHETTINVKEGLIIYLFYSEINKPTLQNLANVINELKSIKVGNESVDNKTIDEISRWLDSTPLNKTTLNNLIDYWSVANYIKSSISSKNTILTRTGIFDDIRKVGETLTGMRSDKWNPGDMYAIDRNFLSQISTELNYINRNKPVDAIGLLNDLFSHDFKYTNELKGSIISISIKQEKAQGGKAKQYFKKLTNDESSYNVTVDEQNLSVEELQNKIDQLRKQISTECKKATVNVELEQDTKKYEGDKLEIISKYSSLKLASVLLSDGSKIGENLLGAAAFSASISGVNPTFFKITGNSNGIPNITKFQAGETISMLQNGVNSKDSTVKIIDRNSNKQIIFLFDIAKGEHSYHIHLNARPNGNIQSTLEIEKFKEF